MSIEKIREVPRDLPAARLYLDDIKEITQIMVDAVAPILLRFHEDPNVVYTFGHGSRASTKATSIEDLKSVGGSSSHFQIKVGGSLGIELRVRGSLSPELSLYSLSEVEARAGYQKIESVFLHRSLVLKNSLLQLPSWAKSVAWWLSAIVLPLAITTVIGANRLNLGTKLTIGLMCTALALIIIGGGLIHTFQSSQVVFADSYEQSRQTLESRKHTRRAFAFALLGAGLTLVVQIIFKEWFH